MNSSPILCGNRLAWRCRRGMLELDLLLQGFLDKGYEQLNGPQRRLFEQLLDWLDQDLLEHLLGLKQSRDGDVQDVIERIRRATHS